MWVPIEAEVADILELELEAVVGHPIRVQGTELQFSAKDIKSYKLLVISPAPWPHVLCFALGYKAQKPGQTSGLPLSHSPAVGQQPLGQRSPTELNLWSNCYTRTIEEGDLG